MSEPQHKHRDATSLDALSQARPGAPGLRLQRAAMGASLAFVGVASAVLLWQFVRPIPHPAPGLEPVQPTIAAVDPPGVLTSAQSMADRRDTLAALADAGNIFAPDRKPWPTSATAAGDSEKNQTTTVILGGGASASQPPPERDDSGRLDLSQVILTPVTNKLPPALFREASAMRVEIIFGAVMPTPEQSQLGAVVRVGKIAQVVREGGTITTEGDGWFVFAIDPYSDRVIVSRDGYNVELRLHDAINAPLIAGVSTAQRPSPLLGVQAHRIAVANVTADQVRAELTAAGLAPWEIDTVLRLAQREDEPKKTDDIANVARKESASKTDGEARPAGSPPAVPTDIAALLKMMATGHAPGAPVKPAPPAPKPDAPKPDAPKSR